jgi:hypothetical protein
LPRLVALLALLVPAVSAVAVVATPTPAAAAPVTITDTRSGPLGPVTVLGDSVLMGAGLFGPTLPTRLVEQGWGPIRFQAGEGYSTGYWDVPASFRATTYLAQWRAQGWDPGHVIVNLGANDSGFAGTDVAKAKAAILHLVDAIGPGRQIWWPKITRFYTHLGQQHAWNTALDQVVAERPNVHTWDWPAVMASGGYPSSDATHLSPDGYRLRSLVMAQAFTDTFWARRIGPDASVPPTAGAASGYLPLGPLRVVDTRRDAPGRLPAGGRLTVDLSASVPEGTTAVAVQLTAAAPTAAGHLSGGPCSGSGGGGRRVSNVNYAAGVSRGAMAVLPVDEAGRLCVTTHAAADVIVDLQGAFVPDGGDLQTFTPLATPNRRLDTRRTGRAEVHRVGVPSGATAVAVNLTAVGAARAGHLTAWSCEGPAPRVSNVNFGPGEPVAGAAFVPVGPDGEICVAASTADVDVVVDLTGTFGPGEGLRFVPAVPTRMHDSRTGAGGWAPIHGADQTLDVRVAPSAARAVTGTLTIVTPVTAAHLTAHACGERPPTSNVNVTAGGVLANTVTTGIGTDGRLCLHAPRRTHSIFDVTGWWVP